MRRIQVLVVLVVALGACKKPENERCAAFATRAADCAAGSEHFGRLPEPDWTNVRDKAYEVCTGTSDDPAAIRWYGNVAAKTECATRQGSCGEFLACWDEVDARSSGR